MPEQDIAAKRLLQFFFIAGQLKSLQRTGWVKKLKMRTVESVADHTYRTAFIVMVMSDLKGLDAERAMKMAMIHDLPEAIIGDLIPGELPTEDKSAKETAAMKALLRNLPPRLKREYGEIWEDLVSGASPEAGLVKQVDKLEMALQAGEYGRVRGKHGTGVFIRSAFRKMKDPDLVEMMRHL